MARTPIHPGEHLAEELRELDVSAAEAGALKLYRFYAAKSS